MMLKYFPRRRRKVPGEIETKLSLPYVHLVASDRDKDATRVGPASRRRSLHPITAVFGSLP